MTFIEAKKRNLVFDDRFLSHRSQCYWCAHFKGTAGDDSFTCAAFPEGIPMRFYGAQETHMEVKEDQTGKTVFRMKNLGEGMTLRHMQGIYKTMGLSIL